MPTKKKAIRAKTTIVIESESLKDLSESLAVAAELAKNYVMFMSFGSKRKNGPHVSVRTTKVRHKAAKAID